LLACYSAFSATAGVKPSVAEKLDHPNQRKSESMVSYCPIPGFPVIHGPYFLPSLNVQLPSSRICKTWMPLMYSVMVTGFVPDTVAFRTSPSFRYCEALCPWHSSRFTQAPLGPPQLAMWQYGLVQIKLQ